MPSIIDAIRIELDVRTDGLPSHTVKLAPPITEDNVVVMMRIWRAEFAKEMEKLRAEGAQGFGIGD